MNTDNPKSLNFKIKKELNYLSVFICVHLWFQFFCNG